MLRLFNRAEHRVCVMQFNSFGDIFSQTIALIHNQDEGLISKKLVLIPTFKSINKEKFNADLFRDIKFSIQSSSETVVLKIPAFFQLILLKMIDYNFRIKNPLLLPKLTVTSSQLKLRKDQILKYRNCLRVSQTSDLSFSKILDSNGIDENYIVVAIRSALSTKSQLPTQSEILRSSSVNNYVPTLNYLSTKYKKIILFSDEKPSFVLPVNVLDYNRSPLKSNLMDYMLPIRSKVLIGNLYGITDTRLMEFKGVFIATDVPILTLHWGALIDFALPKKLSSSRGDLKFTLQSLYNKKYFQNHIYTDDFFDDFKVDANTPQELLYFVKKSLEDPIPSRIRNVEQNKILNELGVVASAQYLDSSQSGLDSPIDCCISKKFLDDNFLSF